MTVTRSGELEALGFEEPEPGCIADTPHNRRLLRTLEGDWQYERVLDEDGFPTTGLIRPLSPEVLKQRRQAGHERYRSLLTDPDDPWSDYLSPDDLSTSTMVGLAPDWVVQRLSQWRYWEREGRDPKKPFPVRCPAVRGDGTRCWSWVSNPANAPVCRAHLHGTANDLSRVVDIARIKVYEGSVDAADTLIDLATGAESEQVKLKASTEILDRAGVRGGTELEINGKLEVTDPTEEVRNKISTLQERLIKAQAAIEAASAPDPATIVEAEVIPDEPS